jgi:hypothetical protein
VLIALVPGQAAIWNGALTTSLAAITDGQAKTDGRLLGEGVAAAMIALRANDGSAPPQNYAPPPPEPGRWQKTASCPAGGGTNFHWGRLTPFGVPDVARFRLGPPPALTSGAYAKAYAEVAQVGGIDSVMRPQDREDVARFYAAFSPVSWANSAARQVSAAGQASLPENARALALLNMAVADASIAVFETKYYYAFWRPETAIRNGETDDNAKTDPDPAFTPLISAPCFPGYPSAHGTLSDAAREVLERLYGPGGHDITFSIAALPGVTLDYTDFKRIVEDIADARVYGGIHFRFDQEAGADQGHDVAGYVLGNLLEAAHH